MFDDSCAYVVDVLLIGWKLRKDGAPTSIASHVDSISVSDHEISACHSRLDSTSARFSAEICGTQDLSGIG